MKYIITTVLLVGLLACKGGNKKGESEMENPVTDHVVLKKPKYPETLSKVFEAHGGIAYWKSKKSLVFGLGEEVHTVDLHSRMDRIDGPGYSMGFNGSKVWLLDEDNKYKGDAVFYHNLMSYFYNMPFVLGDNGIFYGETEDLHFQGVDYPGIRISFDSGIGTSPKDEYYIHYDPISYKMTWLGYTVSYRSGERSDNVKWIGYHDWMDVGGVLVPKALTWYDYEGRTIKGAKAPVVFKSVELLEEAKPITFFGKPEKALFVEAKGGAN